MNYVPHRITSSDPLAKALEAAPMPRAYAFVDGQFFILRQWSIKCGCGDDFLESSWDPADQLIAAYTIPLRFKIHMRLGYWRRKLFGRAT